MIRLASATKGTHWVNVDHIIEVGVSTTGATWVSMNRVVYEETVYDVDAGPEEIVRQIHEARLKRSEPRPHFALAPPEGEDLPPLAGPGDV